MFRVFWYKVTMALCRKFDISPCLAHILLMALMAILVVLFDPSIISATQHQITTRGDWSGIWIPLGFSTAVLIINYFIFKDRYLKRPSNGGGI